MITNKDIRVDNGNLILNGDKYPLDGQSPESIMEIVEDNSDSTPTENSTAPVTSGGVFTALSDKQDTLTFDTTPTANSTNPVESGGVYDAIEAYDNATVQQLNIFKNNKTVSIYGLLQNLSSSDTLIEYTTLEEKYRPAAGYVIAPLISTTAPYLPVGSVWIQCSTGKVSVYKEAARTDGYVSLTYLT